jgi:hypothetical protein
VLDVDERKDVSEQLVADRSVEQAPVPGGPGRAEQQERVLQQRVVAIHPKAQVRGRWVNNRNGGGGGWEWS